MFACSGCSPQGERINRVYEATGVSKIDVKDGLVRIVGPTNAAVLQAREMLELIQVRPCPGTHHTHAHTYTRALAHTCLPLPAPQTAMTSIRPWPEGLPSAPGRLISLTLLPWAPPS
jgi:hypothetical protein